MDEENTTNDTKTDSVKKTKQKKQRPSWKKLAVTGVTMVILISLIGGGFAWQNSRTTQLRDQVQDLEKQVEEKDKTDSELLSELTSQTDGLETNLGNLKGRIDEFLREQQQESERYEVKLDATVLESSDEKLKVKVYDEDCYCIQEKEKLVKIIKVNLTNNSQVDVYFGTYSIAGLTSDGKLIESVEVTAADRKGQSLNFQLAPGGQAEAYVYIPDTSITGIYLNDTDESIGF
jgi:cell division protein FtsL